MSAREARCSTTATVKSFRFLKKNCTLLLSVLLERGGARKRE